MKANKKFVLGFTMIEIIVSVAIIAILATFTMISLSEFRNTQQIKNTQEDVLSIFHAAKARTLASKDLSVFGVHIETTGLTLFVGDTYDEESADNEIMMLDDSVEITDIDLSDEGVDVVYNRLTGGASVSGSFLLRSKEDPSQTHTITITKTGIIDISS